MSKNGSYEGWKEGGKEGRKGERRKEGVKKWRNDEEKGGRKEKR